MFAISCELIHQKKEELRDKPVIIVDKSGKIVCISYCLREKYHLAKKPTRQEIIARCKEHVYEFE